MGFFDRFRKKQKTGRPEETAAGPASVKAKPAEAEPVEPDAGDIGGESLSIGISPEEDYILAGSSGRAFRKYMLDWNYTVRES